MIYRIVHPPTPLPKLYGVGVEEGEGTEGRGYPMTQNWGISEFSII